MNVRRRLMVSVALAPMLAISSIPAWAATASPADEAKPSSPAAERSKSPQAERADQRLRDRHDSEHADPAGPLTGGDGGVVRSLIVKYRPGTPAKTNGEPTGTQSLSVETSAGVGVGNGFRTVLLDEPVSDRTASKLAKKLQTDPRVVSAEPNSRVFADAALTPVAEPNDSRFDDQWDLNSAGLSTGNPGLGINARYGWARTTGGSAAPVVAVLDTGSTTHPDLAGRWLPGYDMISDPLSANDGGGRDSDATDSGDWISDHESTHGYFKYCDERDSSWHGTHVAGTIGATRNNNTGITGIVDSAKILPVRVLGKCGGSRADIAAGITWASGGTVSGVPDNPNPAGVINLSLGGGGDTCPAVYQSAINAAVTRGSTIVVSAGNDSATASTATPANCNNVITVAALDEAGSRAPYSNYGSTVDIAAPGGYYDGVLSTVNSGSTTPQGASYGWMNGTSMAAPHVAGAAALYKAWKPSASPAAVEAAIKSSAATLPNSSSPDYSCILGDRYSCGAGILDLAALLDVDTGPGSVNGATAHIASEDSIVVKFSAPSGSATSYGFGAELYNDETDDWEVVDLGNTTQTQVTLAVEDAEGIDYLRITPSNSTGVGPSSSIDVSDGRPGQVRGLELEDLGSGQVAVTWDEPLDEGLSPITGYRVHERDTYTEMGVGPNARSATFSGLTASSGADVEVAAINEHGVSWYAYEYIQLNAASEPRNLAATATAPGELRIEWDAPSKNGGSAITGYEINVDDEIDEEDEELVFRSVSGMSTTLTGLTTGQTVRVRVRAVTDLRSGGDAMAYGFPQGLPGVVTGLASTYNGSSATTTWTAPDNLWQTQTDVTGYTATIAPGGPSVVVTGTSAAANNLAAGIDYTLTVRPTSGFGPGTAATTTLRLPAVVAPPTTPPTAPPAASPAPVRQPHNWAGAKKTVKRKKSFTIRGTSTAGIPVKIKAKGACTVKKSGSGWKVTGKKKGTCTLTYTAPGTTTHLPLAGKSKVKVK